MFKIVGEYKGTIKNGFMLAGENFLPGRKRTIRVDEIQLKKLTQGQENGWFIIHSCEPANPFLKAKVRELVEEAVETPVEEAVETPVEEAVETPVEEVVETSAEEVVETPAEEVKEEVPVKEVKEEAPKKKNSRSKKKAESEEVAE